MGRTGRLWAWQHAGVRPDAMTLAKGLGGGLPIGACVTSPKCSDVLRAGDHGSTFAGGPVACQAAHAVLDVVTADGFLEAVQQNGETLLSGLDELSGGRARGEGLMVAFEADDAPSLARRALIEERLIVNATGPSTIRLLPPLTVSEAEIEDALARLARVVATPVGSGA